MFDRRKKIDSFIFLLFFVTQRAFFPPSRLAATLPLSRLALPRLAATLPVHVATLLFHVPVNRVTVTAALQHQ